MHCKKYFFKCGKLLCLTERRFPLQAEVEGRPSVGGDRPEPDRNVIHPRIPRRRHPGSRFGQRHLHHKEPGLPWLPGQHGRGVGAREPAEHQDQDQDQLVRKNNVYLLSIHCAHIFSPIQILTLFFVLKPVHGVHLSLPSRRPGGLRRPPRPPPVEQHRPLLQPPPQGISPGDLWQPGQDQVQDGLIRQGEGIQGVGEGG